MSHRGPSNLATGSARTAAAQKSISCLQRWTNGRTRTVGPWFVSGQLISFWFLMVGQVSEAILIEGTDEIFLFLL